MYSPYTEYQPQTPVYMREDARNVLKNRWLKHGFHPLDADILADEELALRMDMAHNGFTGNENMDMTVKWYRGEPSIVMAEVNQ